MTESNLQYSDLLTKLEVAEEFAAVLKSRRVPSEEAEEAEEMQSLFPYTPTLQEMLVDLVDSVEESYCISAS